MKSQKWMVVFAVVIVAAMIFSACQPAPAPAPEKVVETVVVEKQVEKVVEKVVEVEKTAVDEMGAVKDFLKGKKICAVFPGPVNDAGWTTAAYLGLVNLRDNFGMEIAYREHTLPEETADVMREYAEAGCDVIHAHGFEYADQIDQVSAEYPDIQFTQTSRGTGKEPNVVGLSFVSGEEGYFAGRIACHLSKTGRIGYVVGQTYPNLQWNQKMAEVAFDDMVKAGLKDKPCVVDWLEVGSWADPAKAKELTAAAIEAGDDVFIMVADAGDAGIIEAIADARKAGKEVYAVSGVKDKNYLGPEFVVGGYEEHVWKQMELAVVEFAKAGKPVGKSMPVGVLDEAIVFAPMYGLLTPEAEADFVKVFTCYKEKGADCELMGDVQFRTDL